MNFTFILKEVCECCILGVPVTLVCVYGSCFIFVHIFHVENASSLRETWYRRGSLISKSVA